MNLLPYLAQAFDVTVIGRKRPNTAPSLEQIPFVPRVSFPSERLKFVQLDASSRKAYRSQLTAYIKQYPSTYFQVENRPRIVPHIKQVLPQAQIWLVLHSVKYISPKRIKHETLKKAFRQCMRIVVNSHFLKNYVLDRFPDLDAKILVNHLGVNAAYFTPAHPPQQAVEDALPAQNVSPMQSEWLHLLKDKTVILYVGRLLKMKGVHHLLQAMQQIRGDFPQAKLMIIGSSRYGKNKQSAYVRKVKRLVSSMPDTVFFQPHVSHQLLPDWYRLSDLFVCPSLDKEAFGLVNLEAMASGLPVIATRTGGIPEVIVDQRTGILVPKERHVDQLAGALRELLSDPEKREQMGQNAREHVLQHHSWDLTARRLIDDYENDEGVLKKALDKCRSILSQK